MSNHVFKFNSSKCTEFFKNNLKNILKFDGDIWPVKKLTKYVIYFQKNAGQLLNLPLVNSCDTV